MTDTILTVLVTLLGGLNIYQLIFPRVAKKKMSAEAGQAEADCKKANIDAYDALIEQFKELQDGFMEQAKRARDNALELNKLMLKTAEYKEVRCYRLSCTERVPERPSNMPKPEDGEIKEINDENDN